MIYALDSDIISYMLKNDRDVQKNFINIIGNKNDYCIPPIVYYEVKRGLNYKKANVKLKSLERLYSGSIKNEMTKEIWEKAIEIYVRLKSQGKIIGDGDIFIASFCIVNDYTLITNNQKHHGNIKELKLINLM